MSIITFWSGGREQVGKTLSMVAIATYMAIEHNYKILVMSTSYNDKTIDNCFWTKEVENKKKNFGIFGPNTNTYMGNGLEGLVPMLKSNKIKPDLITNYTKVIFKDRLEILKSFSGTPEEYKEAVNYYSEIIRAANNFYDLVFVDLDNSVGSQVAGELLNESTIIMATLSQRMSSLNRFLELQQKNELFRSPKVLLLIGRYDRYSKYTLKNITRYMKERNKISTVPYNTLYFEAAEESAVPDLFLRFKRLKDEQDRNYLFMSELKRCSENIMYRLQDLQMKL